MGPSFSVLFSTLAIWLVASGPAFQRSFLPRTNCCWKAWHTTPSTRHNGPVSVVIRFGWVWCLRTELTKNERWSDKNLFDTRERRRPEWVIAFSLRLLGLPLGAVAPPCECDDDNDEPESQAKINIIAQPVRRHQRRMLGRRMLPLLISPGPFRRRHPPRLLFGVNLRSTAYSAIRQTSIADWRLALWSINPQKAECGRLSQWEHGSAVVIDNRGLRLIS